MAWHLLEEILTTTIWATCVGVYGMWSLQALLVSRYLPERVQLLKDGRVVAEAVLRPGFRTRLRIYAGIGVSLWAFMISQWIIDVWHGLFG